MNAGKPMDEAQVIARRVLVVDDNPGMLDALLEFFSTGPNQGSGASSVQAAIDAIDREAPDVLLCDWDLGERLSGVDVAAHARQRAPGMGVILMTGRSLDELMQDARPLEVDAFLRKPFSLRELSATLEALPR